MTDDTSQPVRLHLTRNTKIGLAIVVLIFWTMCARQWESKDCTLPQGYRLVLSHGTPDRWEGCEDGLGGPMYTDNYYGD